MKSRLIPMAIVAVVVTVLWVVFAQWYAGGHGNIMSTDFPEKTSHRVELRPEDAKETIRISYVNDAGKTAITEIQYVNGVTSYVFFQPDGEKPAKILDFYPEETAGQVDRKLKSETFFSDAQSGNLMVRHTAYREDGTIERGGVRQADETYRTLYFAEDGTSVVKVRVFDKELKFVSEEEFFSDGKVKVKTEKDGYNIVTTYFREDGTKAVESATSYSGHNGTFYWEDGVTVKAKFTSSSYTLTVQYHDEKGVIYAEVDYRKDKMDVTIVSPDDSDRYLFKQVYERIGAETETPQCEGEYNLRQVTEYHMWGTSKWQKKTRMIVEFDDSGKPSKVTVPTNKNLKYIYTLDDNGVVIDKTTEGKPTGSGAGGSADGAVTYEVGDKFEIDPELLKARSYECLDIPPKNENVVSPPPYYYYGPF